LAKAGGGAWNRGPIVRALRRLGGRQGEMSVGPGPWIERPGLPVHRVVVADGPVAQPICPSRALDSSDEKAFSIHSPVPVFDGNHESDEYLLARGVLHPFEKGVGSHAKPSYKDVDAAVTTLLPKVELEMLSCATKRS
jgi:hypothetical protein